MMSRVTLATAFVFLLILSVVLLVTITMNQTAVRSMNNYPRKSLIKSNHSGNDTSSLVTEDSNKAIHRVKEKHMKEDPKSLYVYPGPSSLAFESSPVLPYFYRLPQSHHPSDKHRVHQKLNESLADLSVKRNQSKLILFYNIPGWYRKDAMSYCREGVSKCPIKSCKCSENSKHLENADAVIIDGVELKMTSPMIKQASQVWIFFTHESPFFFYFSNYKNEKWRQMFNWTMTYRLDSDIPIPYNLLLYRPTSKNYTAIALKKTKSAVWLVSNCETPGKRDIFVKQLQKYYHVDIFGRCTKQTRVDDVTLLNQYRFYLAFENSFCFDYVTEKLFKTYAAPINIIPVVRGGANYDTMIPNGTFINTAHFKSPKELGKYLSYLETNVTAYTEFLQRNDQFDNRGSNFIFKKSFCDLCVKMHNLKRYKNWYTDIGEWYNDGVCTKPTDF